jgi:hypothetical protein
MDGVDKGTHSLRRESMDHGTSQWVHFSDHLNGKTRSKKMGPFGVLIKEEDPTMIAWTWTMQECGLSISL